MPEARAALRQSSYSGAMFQTLPAARPILTRTGPAGVSTSIHRAVEHQPAVNLVPQAKRRALLKKPPGDLPIGVRRREDVDHVAGPSLFHRHGSHPHVERSGLEQRVDEGG